MPPTGRATIPQALGVDADECIALEDSAPGASAAVAAGVRTVGVLSTQPAAALTAAGCTTLVTDFDDPALWDVLGVGTTRTRSDGDDLSEGH